MTTKTQPKLIVKTVIIEINMNSVNGCKIPMAIKSRNPTQTCTKNRILPKFDAYLRPYITVTRDVPQIPLLKINSITGNSME